MATRTAAVLLLAACVLLLSVAAQEPVTVLRGSGPAETAALVHRVLHTVKSRAGKPTHFSYRSLPPANKSGGLSDSDLAVLDFINNASIVDFAVSSRPLSTAQWASQGAGRVMQVPFALYTLSVYYNIPGGNTAPLNLTACVLQKLLTGSITTWVPSLVQDNPTLGITDQNIGINAFMDAPSSLATQVLLSYLKTTPCPITSASQMVATYSAEVAESVMKTSYSIGYALTYKGKALGLKEAAIQNFEQDFVTSSTFNLTSTQGAVAAVLPASPTSDFSSIAVTNLLGLKVYPALGVAYLNLRTDQTSTGDKGALLQACALFLLSTEAQQFNNAAGMLPIGDTSRTVAAVSSGISLQAGVSPYTLEPQGTVSPTGQGMQTISATRTNYERMMLDDLQTQVAALGSMVSQALPKLLRGSGSAAVAMVMWRAMDILASQATTPIWTSYRAISSGEGEAELAGNPIGGPAAVDFACSDNPMTKGTYTALANAGIKVLHIPMYVAPVSLFYNIPASALPERRLRLSPCTVAGIFQGSIRTWDDPAIAADNPSANLPAQPIIPVYRSGAPGTNGIFSQYFASTCPGWLLGSGRVLPAPGASGSFSTAAVGVQSPTDMVDTIANRTWSIGYSDTGPGVLAGLPEVYLKNKAGVWLRAQTADLPGVVSQMFHSGEWPSDPTADFSGVSLLDKPGEKTWPLSSVPFMLVRLDFTRGFSGPLLKAYLWYFLSGAFQSLLPVMGFASLPPDLVSYAVDKVLPLISVDTRAASWYFEPAGGRRFQGAVDNTFSAAKETYTMFATNQYMTSYYQVAQAAAVTLEVRNTTTNNTGFNITHLAMLQELQDSVSDYKKQLAVLQSVAIASLIFGMAALGLSIFASCKLFVVGVLSSKRQVGNINPRGSLGRDGSNASASTANFRYVKTEGPGGSSGASEIRAQV